ncbi:hypothetical protein BDP67DRAFT_203444 [Colletotrichum lupini]|nr:hypothetical protein BDP67DRAFT_203444 [Colletotrichum lupini]
MVQIAERSPAVVKRSSEKRLMCPAGIVLPAAPSWCGELCCSQKAEIAFFLTGVARNVRCQCSGRVLMLLDRRSYDVCGCVELPGRYGGIGCFGAQEAGMTQVALKTCDGEARIGKKGIGEQSRGPAHRGVGISKRRERGGRLTRHLVGPCATARSSSARVDNKPFGGGKRVELGSRDHSGERKQRDWALCRRSRNNLQRNG